MHLFFYASTLWGANIEKLKQNYITMKHFILFIFVLLPFFVLSQLKETSLPQLVEIEPLSLSILRFTFDKAVEIKGATFSISEIGNAYQKSYLDEETRLSVNVLFEKEMKLGKVYTISYS